MIEIEEEDEDVIEFFEPASKTNNGNNESNGVQGSLGKRVKIIHIIKNQL